MYGVAEILHNYNGVCNLTNETWVHEYFSCTRRVYILNNHFTCAPLLKVFGVVFKNRRIQVRSATAGGCLV